MKLWQTARQLMKHVLFTRPRRPVRHARGWLGIDILEDRLCPSGYVITDLGRGASFQESSQSINSSGQVAGTVDKGVSPNGDRLFAYGPGGIISNSFGGRFSRGQGINNLGDVVGGADITLQNQNGNADSHAFLYHHGTGVLQDLGTLGGRTSFAIGVNDLDQATGLSDTTQVGFDIDVHAFRYSGGQLTDLDQSAFGRSISVGRAINNHGDVVGFVEPNFGNDRAFISHDGAGMTLLPVGGAYSDAYAINDAGQVVGEAGGHAGGHAFIYDTGTGTVTNLGTLGVNGVDGDGSVAYGINNFGQVVGSSSNGNPPETPFGVRRAFLYTNSKMIDLNSLIAANSGWILQGATGINDTGQIVGYGVGPSSYLQFPGGQPFFDQASTFLLTPADNDIEVKSIHTDDSASVTISYDIKSLDDVMAVHPFKIGIYRAPTDHFDAAADQLIGSVEIQGDGAKLGPHKVTVNLAGGLPPRPSTPYVLAVADPDHELTGVAIDDSAAHFRVYVIGAVSVGFDPTEQESTSLPPAWVDAMAKSLGGPALVGGPGLYDRAISFGWASGSPSPGAIIQAGKDLYQQVATAAQSLPNLQPDDVIDVHLIGHSRGTVVISEAMSELVASPPNQQLEHGYFKMSLLDPHSANNVYGPNASFGNLGVLTDTIIPGGYLGFQASVHDGPVVVPARVNQAEEFYQQSDTTFLYGGTWPNYQLSSFPFAEAFVFNLWGLSPSEVTHDPKTFQSYNLTGEGIGHSEVHEWYQAKVVPALPLGGTVPAPAIPPGILLAGPTTSEGILAGALEAYYLVFSPVTLLITDPLGRRLGVDPVTGTAVNDFGPQATVTGTDSEPEVFTIPVGSVIPGPYQVSGVGTGSGPYHIVLAIAGQGNPSQILYSQVIASGTAVPGQPIDSIQDMSLVDLATTPRPPTSPPPAPPAPGLVHLTAQSVPAGQDPIVTVLNADGSLRFTLTALGGAFTGGAGVAVGDVNGDGTDDVIVGAGDGGGPRVQVFDGNTGTVIADFFAFDPDFRGGVNAAAGADGTLIAGAGAGGAPHVKVFRLSDGSELASFFAFDPDFRGGVRVATGDVTGDGVSDIVIGAGPSGGPRVLVFDGSTGTELASFFVGPAGDRTGADVRVRDLGGDGQNEVVARAAGRIGAFAPLTGADLTGQFDPALLGSVFVD